MDPKTTRSITLPTVAFDLPDGPGKPLVLDRCVACHTPRYITLQPYFTRDAWIATVQKMRKNFGAPVADEQVEDIVNYLVFVRGKPEMPARETK